MELAHPASTFAPEDVISSMPDNVLTNVMDRLPIRDAVRTSILSGNWRFKWTMLSQLVLDNSFFMYLSLTKGEKNPGGIISRLLLHLNGTVTKFYVHIGTRNCFVSDQDINHWILFLSKKGLKDFTLRMMNGTVLKLPSHLLSCLELKHLTLFGCCFDPPLTFHGFPNLLSLELSMVLSEKKKFRQFISRCPALEILKIGVMYPLTIEGGILKLVDIAKLANLKTLSVLLCNFSEMEIKSSSRIFELVGFFPKLEYLHLDFLKSKLTEGDYSEKALSTTFPCLKVLKLTSVDLENGVMLSCVTEMIRRSLNLRTLVIYPNENVNILTQQPAPAIPSQAVNYKTMGLLQLQSAVIKNASENENEVRLIEYVLSCSPFLRKIVIYPRCDLSSDETIRLTKKLLVLQRASPQAKVYFN